jgi:branched-chain amino acid transport system permease protein
MSQTAIQTIDGNWYSPQWGYGYTLKDGVGIATSTNSPNFQVGQNIIQLRALSATTFTGQQVYTDGRFYLVNVILQPDGRLYFEGEKNAKWLMERVAYRPLRGAPRLAPLITAIGISIILQHVAMMIWGRSPISFPQIIKTHTFDIGGALITNIQIAIILISFALMGGLIWLVYRTKLGVAMRATSQRQDIAGLMGIDINKVISATFIIGAGLAAVAGVMIGTYYGQTQYTMGELLGLKAFCAAVLGGIGNLGGAVLGGILMGLVEALGTGYIGDLTNNWFGSNYRDVFAFVVLILVLVFRPSGLLGERVGDRA